jgi:methylglutaconyl-CoA hydratase
MMMSLPGTLMTKASMDDSVLCERRGTTAWLTLNRPQVHNAFDDTLIAALTDLLESVDADPSVHRVVLTGNGSCFSAGADLHWMRGMAGASEQDNLADSLRLATLMRTLQFLSKPTVARVNGAAYGGGVGLVACCDIAVGVDTAKFALSEVKLGLVPAVISPYVIDAIGLREARRLFITGEVFEADVAARIGLLHVVVGGSELDEAIERQLYLLAKAGPQAQREAKQLALRVGGSDVAQAERIDAANAALIARLRVSDEGQHGLGAFLDKRAPRWVAQP